MGLRRRNNRVPRYGELKRLSGNVGGRSSKERAMKLREEVMRSSCWIAKKAATREHKKWSDPRGDLHN